MPLDNIGLSFLPGAGTDNGLDTKPTAQLDDVVQILSYRLPRILGARAISPDALLNSQGSAGDPLGDSIARQILDSIVRKQPGGPSMASAGGPGTSALDDLLRRSIPGGGVGSTAPADPTPGEPLPKPRIIPIESPAPTGRGVPAPQPRLGPARQRDQDYFPGSDGDRRRY